MYLQLNKLTIAIFINLKERKLFAKAKNTLTSKISNYLSHILSTICKGENNIFLQIMLLVYLKINFILLERNYVFYEKNKRM